MSITQLQPFNLDSTANYTFANVTATNANLGNAATANFFIGSGNNLSNIQAANITGTITATTAGTVTTNAQPNITSVGTLTSVSVSGNATIGNLSVSGVVNTNLIPVGNGVQSLGNATNQWSNLFLTGNTIYLGNATISSNASSIVLTTPTGGQTVIAGNTGNSDISGQTLSITGNATIGNIISSGSGGNITGANVISANLLTGTLTTAAQPNITSTGTLSSISVSGTSNLGNVGNVKITGGTNGQVLSTDGAGNLTFADTASSNSAAPMPYVVSVGESYTVPENFQGLFTVPITIDGELEVNGILAEVGTAINSLNSQIIFDDNGELTGNVGFTFDTVSGNLAVPGSATVSSILTNNYYYANGQPLSFGGAPGGSTTQLQYNNAGSFGGISTATYSGGKLSLGSNAEVKITGGTNGQVLSTDGAGNLSWANGGGSTGFLSITSRSGIIEVNIIGGYLNIVGRSGTIPIPIS
jgi:hypothetical protein